jgi:hypothetical protein
MHRTSHIKTFLQFGCSLLLYTTPPPKKKYHTHYIIKNFITILKLIQVIKKFTYKSAAVTDGKANGYNKNVLNCKASLNCKLFAFQIARHLAFIVNGTKLRYTTSLFLPTTFAKCCITPGCMYSTS